MILIVGLGNPGKKYLNSRHNLGFLVIDSIKNHFNFPEFKKNFFGLLTKKKIFGEEIILLKPHSYMNASGNSVEKIMNYFKIPNENILVFHDDLDMKIGKIRIKKFGGHGGHNGIRDIISKIGNNFSRLKVGIKIDENKLNPEDFVLKDFSRNEKQKIKIAIDFITKNFEYMVQNKFTLVNNLKEE